MNAPPEKDNSQTAIASSDAPPNGSHAVSTLQDEASDCSDQVLMVRAQQGETEAFAELVQRHQRSVHAFLATRLLQPADAEDLTQEVFLRCYQARDRFDVNALVRPFLMGIARNVLREHARRQSGRREIIWTELCLEIEQDAGGDEQRIYDDVLGHLPACLSALSDPARRALNLHFRNKQRYAAIAKELGRSVGAVKVMLFRARRTLKECLDRKLAQGE